MYVRELTTFRSPPQECIVENRSPSNSREKKWVGYECALLSLFCTIGSLLAATKIPARFALRLCKKSLWHRHYGRFSARKSRSNFAISLFLSLLAGKAAFRGFSNSWV